MFNFRKIVALVLTVVLVGVSCGAFGVSASRESELKNEISRLEQQSKEIEAKIKKLKNQNANQQEIADALQQKINNAEKQIITCNNEISKINSSISANNAEIERQNKEIEAAKLTFKKRLRAIYMNNADSSAQLLLGADSFADFLQLEQLTASISAHDKAIMEDIVEVISQLEEKKKENEKLLEAQVSIKNTIVSKQKELEADQSEIYSVINSINNETTNLASQNSKIKAQLNKAQKDLDNLFKSYGTHSNIVYDGQGFYWPVPSYRGWTTYTGHSGIDIQGKYGAPIVASASGQVITVTTGHVRNPGVGGLASYGNYVVIDHGNKNGSNYKTLYAHMSAVNVRNGQQVKQGQVIGYVGNSGNTWGATGTHLHFELRINNAYTYPVNYLR